MPSVTIDAGVLAIPPEHGSIDELRHYVKTLLDCSELLNTPWVAIYMSERASEALWYDDLYPEWHKLNHLFTATGIEEYDATTVLPIVQRILQRTPSFENHFRIKEVVYGKMTTQPDVLTLCSGPHLKDDLARCLLLIAILRSHFPQSAVDHSLILRHASHMTIQIRALIHILEHNRDDLITLPSPPDYFNGDVQVCDDFRGLILSLNEVNILLNATDAGGVKIAIHVAFFKARVDQGDTLDWDDIPIFSIGNVFFESFSSRRPTPDLSRKLLRAIVETLEQSNLHQTHPLRNNEGGASPPRVRRTDQAKAWRRDIDRDHHLHYWITDENIVELASLSFPHNDFTIPE